MEYLPAWMFLALTILLMAGFLVTFTLMGTAMCFGLIGFGWSFFNLLPLRIWGVMTNVTLIAVPLFVFMGVMLERSGLAEELLIGEPIELRLEQVDLIDDRPELLEDAVVPRPEDLLEDAADPFHSPSV